MDIKSTHEALAALAGAIEGWHLDTERETAWDKALFVVCDEHPELTVSLSICRYGRHTGRIIAVAHRPVPPTDAPTAPRWPSLDEVTFDPARSTAVIARSLTRRLLTEYVTSAGDWLETVAVCASKEAQRATYREHLAQVAGGVINHEDTVYVPMKDGRGWNATLTVPAYGPRVHVEVSNLTEDQALILARTIARL